ncbi:thioesterase family protein [Actinosynnema sp. NPDC023658]|uniref:thioesterase family protein n=1 Tax=Actinosynnema sp. NPDC023658 TaxID=3155465 RepID=UPI0033EC8866
MSRPYGMTGTHRFDTDTAVGAGRNNRWPATVSPAWTTIGGLPHGGYLFALTLAAAAQAADGRPLLTATAHFPRPARLGPADIDVEVVKQGRLTSTATAGLRQDGKERVRVLATYGHPRFLDEPAEPSAGPPSLGGPAHCLVPPPDLAAGLDATVTERFDYRLPPVSRWVGGPGPGTARLDAWIRFADGRAPDLAALPLFVDASPSALGELVGPVAVPTIELTIHLRRQPAPGWVQARMRATRLAGGLVEEDAQLWDSTGRLVAQARQLGLRL